MVCKSISDVITILKHVDFLIIGIFASAELQPWAVVQADIEHPIEFVGSKETESSKL